MVWFEDKQISAELVRIRLLSPELWGTLPLAKRADPVINTNTMCIGSNIPEPLRLLDDTAGVHRDDHQRYRAKLFFCADFLSAGLSGVIRTPLSVIRPGCWPANSLCKTSPELCACATKSKAGKNDSACSNSFNASPLWQYWRGLSGWNFYFLVKVCTHLLIGQAI